MTAFRCELKTFVLCILFRLIIGTARRFALLLTLTLCIIVYVPGVSMQTLYPMYQCAKPGISMHTLYINVYVPGVSMHTLCISVYQAWCINAYPMYQCVTSLVYQCIPCESMVRS